MRNYVIEEINCDNWDSLEKKCRKLSVSNPDYIFRGQYDANWPVNSSFQRFIKTTGTKIFKESEDPFNRLLSYFKPHYDRKFKNQKFSHDDYIGIGQHYGLPTPYLDWTKTIDKAIFFAFCEEITNPLSHEAVALYAFRINHIDTLVDSMNMKEHLKIKKGIKLFEEFGLYLIEPNVKLPNDRIDQQDGIFLKIGGSINQNLDLVQILQKVYNCYNFIRPIIYKFVLRRTDALSVLRNLHLKSGINFSTIYPDRDGFAKQARFEFIINQKST